MKCPAKLQLSREDGEALRTRLAGDGLTADDRRVLDQVLQWYFWLLFALQEAMFSLKRLRAMLFSAKPKQRQEQSTVPRDRDEGASGAGSARDTGDRAPTATER